MQMCPNCSTDNKDTARFCHKCGQALRHLLGKGTVLQNRYRLEKVLGCGGMGAVYLAQDLRLAGAPIAVKENLDASSEAQKQFMNEARILAHLSHTNLPRVRDFFVERSGRQYMVMDYIEGEDLQTLVEKHGPLSSAQALAWMNEVLNAVEYLHTQSPPIIHRDIKPANIKITPYGKPMLVDFGIAKVYQAGSKTSLGAQAVSPGFSPIEQYGQGTTDQRSDIYSLAATLYFLLTGVVPPEAIERAARQTDRLIPPRSINPTISPVIERALWMALRLNSWERFANVNQFRLALAGQLPVKTSVPRPAQPPSKPQPVAPPPPSHQPSAISLFPARIANGFERFAAAFLDAAILIPCICIVTWGVWGLGSMALAMTTGEAIEEEILRKLMLAMFLLSPPLYRLVCHAFWGQTLGKSLLKLHVVTEQGERIGAARAFVRELVYWLSLPLCCLGLFWIAFDPRKQGWHDLLSESYVVKQLDQTAPPPGQQET